MTEASAAPSLAERYLTAWHGRHPDGTRVFTGLRDSDGLSSYERISARLDAAQRILDVACGAGTLLETIAARAPRLQLAGVDLSFVDLRRAAAAVPSARFSVARAQALPFPAASMDAITCHLALMLMDDPVEVLVEMRRVLRPGGRICIAVVNPFGFDQESTTLIRGLAARGTHRAGTRPPPMGDQRTYSARGLAALLADGFVDVETEEVVVSREVYRRELWDFLKHSIYGLDHLTDDEAEDQLTQLAPPSRLLWRVPLCFATATAPTAPC